MKHSIRHGLDKATACKATHKAFEAYQERFRDYSPQANWLQEDHANISFSAKGITLKGTVHIREQDVEVDLDVPFLMRPFQGKAVAVIEEEIKRWVDKARAGKLDEGLG